MISALKRNIVRHITNFPGWRTDRKIVVIESDDWGSIRMPSRAVYEKCLAAGYPVDQNAYERFDSLASEEDLELLFGVLANHKDQHDMPPVMTANILTANPDFEKIKASAYQKYFYELIGDTFARYPKHANCLDLWVEGKERKVFFPQSHGREHLNVSLFMNKLQRGDKDALFALEHQMPGSIPKRVSSSKGNEFVESLHYTNYQDKMQKLSFVIEGLDLFENLMGYRSQSFIPPNYLWSPDFDKQMADRGVKFYQGQRRMKEPLEDGSYRFNSNNLGEENMFGQKYLVRNATFEPTVVNSAGLVSHCLQDISVAFRMQKPAIISSHRLNYVGFIDEQNRDVNLNMLDKLLTEITRRWPDVEFLNSVQLGTLMI